MKNQITIEGSGVHVHLTPEHLAVLFGEGFVLEEKKALSQPGQYASTSRVGIVGPKSSIPAAVVVGPCRKYTQIELSLTDARKLGLECPIRMSGEVAGSSPVTLTGPAGTLELKEGAMIAKRHIHFTPDDAIEYGVSDKEVVQVKIGGERALILDEVICRVDPNAATFMHIDYDEMNGAAMGPGNDVGEIIKKS